MNFAWKYTLRIVPLLVAGLLSAADLLVVSPSTLCEAWRYYAEMRRTEGVSVEVVDTSRIYADFPFGSTNAYPTAADSIHAFIHAAADAGTTHVLLGGAWIDAQALDQPIHFLTGERLSLSNAVPGRMIRPHGATGLESAPSDFFYACRGAVNWDANGNGQLLESGERNRDDLRVRVAVGRFPAIPFAYGDRPLMTAAELVTNYAAKVARGLSAQFTGRQRVGLLGSTQWTSVPAADTSLGLTRGEMMFLDGLPNMWQTGHTPQVSDAEYVLRETLRTVIAPNWPVQDVDAFFYSDAALQTVGDGSLQVARDALLARETLVTACRTHGNATVALNAGGLYLLTQRLYANARGLSLFADFAVPCRTGMVDYTITSNQVVYAAPSLGVAMVCAPDGGAVTGVFNSRDGIDTWTASFSLADGLSLTLATDTLRHLFEEAGDSFGMAFLRARRAFVDTKGTLSNDQVYVLGEQFFLGDPTVGLPNLEKTAVWTDPRLVLETNHVYTSVSVGMLDTEIVGNGRLRVMEQLVSSGTNLTLAVEGGVERGVEFTGTVPGTVTLGGSGSFYVGGLSNCAAVAVTAGRKRMRCTEVARVPKSIRVTEGELILETAESLIPTAETFAAVTNGTLVWAESPRAGWSDGGEHLACPVVLSDALFAIEPTARLSWGRQVGEVYKPFSLQVGGQSCVASSDPLVPAPIGLVGTSTIVLDSAAELMLDVTCEDENAGRLVVMGAGSVRAVHAQALAGGVEVAEGATLILEEVPLNAVTDLVVRTGATVRIPSVVSGRHPLVPLGGRVLLEVGACVTDLAGHTLTGSVANGTFFELSSALRWKGGAGVWSDPRGWFDSGTGAFGAWQAGRTAVFDAPQGACVTNDAESIDLAGLVVASDTVLSGGTIRSVSDDLMIPEGTRLAFQAPLAVTGDVKKKGLGCLAFAGTQAGLTEGALLIDEGRLALTDVVAPGVTNLTVADGACVELKGANALTQAVCRASLATNALVRVDAQPSSLALGLFTPRKSFLVPAGVMLEVRGPIADDGGRAWWPQVEGCLSYQGVMTGAYGFLTGTGVVEVAGLRSRSGSGMGFGPCRLVWCPESPDGRFPLLGFYLRYTAFIVLNGTTVVPGCACVAACADGEPDSEVALYVEEEGAVFETPWGQSLTLEDDGTRILFGGPGDVVKTGGGCFRLAGVDDQHTGATRILAGTYALAGACLSPAFELATGSVLDLSDPYPTVIEATNFVWSAGGEVRLGVSAEGCDCLDLRAQGTNPLESCALHVTGTGALDLTVHVYPNAKAGRYALLRTDGMPREEIVRLLPRVVGGIGRAVHVAWTDDRCDLVLVLGEPGTILLVR